MSGETYKAETLKYLFAIIANNIAIFSQFSISKTLKEAMIYWSEHFTPAPKKIDLLTTIKRLGNLHVAIYNTQPTILNIEYRERFLRDLTFFRTFLQELGSKTGDMDSIMLRTYRNEYKDIGGQTLGEKEYLHLCLKEICQTIVFLSRYNKEITEYFLPYISGADVALYRDYDIKSIYKIYQKILKEGRVPPIANQRMSLLFNYCESALSNTSFSFSDFKDTTESSYTNKNGGGNQVLSNPYIEEEGEVYKHFSKSPGAKRHIVRIEDDYS